MVLYSIFESIVIYLTSVLLLNSILLLPTKLKSLCIQIYIVLNGKNELIFYDFVNTNIGMVELRDYPLFLKSEKPSE